MKKAILNFRNQQLSVKKNIVVKFDSAVKIKKGLNNKEMETGTSFTIPTVIQY